MTQTPFLTVNDLCKSYPGEAGHPVEILRGVSFAASAGETLALTGESGSGKSTLLHLVGGLDQPDSGTIALQGTDISTLNDTRRAALRRDRIGVIFQQFNLIPSLNIRDNIAFQARLANRHDREWCATLATRLDLTAHLGKYPEELSGGQQQRVAVGRALAPRPGMVLADEPTGNLDQATGDAVLDLMLELVSETNAALLMVTHSERLAARMSRRLHLAAGRLA